MPGSLHQSGTKPETPQETWGSGCRPEDVPSPQASRTPVKWIPQNDDMQIPPKELTFGQQMYAGSYFFATRSMETGDIFCKARLQWATSLSSGLRMFPVFGCIFGLFCPPDFPT